MARNTHDWFKFYPRKWTESERVRRMDLAAQGLYIRALAEQFILGSLPSDTDELALVLRVKPSDMRHWEQVLQHFETEVRQGEQRLYNKDLRTELDAAKAKSEKLSANGSKGGRGNVKQKLSKQKAIALQKESESAKAKASLRASSSNSYSKSTSIEDFNTFYATYPNKKAKPLAEKAWKRAVNSALLATQIIEHVKHRTTSDPDWLKDGGSYIPHPATFLNQSRWEDQYKPGDTSPAKGAQPAPARQPRQLIARPKFKALPPDTWQNLIYAMHHENPIDTEELIKPLKPLGIADGHTWLQADSGFTANLVAMRYTHQLEKHLPAPVRIVIPSDFTESDHA